MLSDFVMGKTTDKAERKQALAACRERLAAQQQEIKAKKLGVLVLLYLAFICGAGYLLWALLMKNNPVSRIAIFGFVNLVVNVLLSAVLNGEPLFRWQYLAALVFVCVGIWLVNKAPAQKEKV